MVLHPATGNAGARQQGQLPGHQPPTAGIIGCPRRVCAYTRRDWPSCYFSALTGSSRSPRREIISELCEVGGGGYGTEGGLEVSGAGTVLFLGDAENVYDIWFSISISESPLCS